MNWYNKIKKIADKSLYHGQPVEQIALQEAKRIRSKYPNCSNQDKCLDASYELQKNLTDLGIICAVQFGFFNGNRHAWLDVWTPDGVKILDITADQWGDDIPEIVFGKMEEYPQYTWEE